MRHDETDYGAVRDGTPCGTDMMCIGGECLHVSLLNYDCNVTKCHNRGVCNTYKHCHCDYGWAPPDCLKEGYGGSSDSGPASPYRSLKYNNDLHCRFFIGHKVEINKVLNKVYEQVSLSTINPIISLAQIFMDFIPQNRSSVWENRFSLKLCHTPS
uniref:EGF-like domain-containing protein n=1 Tax=Anolis carolinensis TaxID=28377 RepID=A0A803T5N2_ANOCA